MTKPIMWIKYKPESFWQCIKRRIKRIFRLKDPSVATGKITLPSEDRIKLDNGIIDITTPNEHTFGEVSEVINNWGKNEKR